VPARETGGAAREAGALKVPRRPATAAAGAGRGCALHGSPPGRAGRNGVGGPGILGEDALRDIPGTGPRAPLEGNGSRDATAVCVLILRHARERGADGEAP